MTAALLDTLRPPSTLRRLYASLTLLVVLALFCLSGSILWKFGINYYGVSGSVLSKVHPATYLAFVTSVVAMAAFGGPKRFLALLIERHPGALVLFVCTCALAVHIFLGKYHGILVVFDTYLLAAMVAVLIGELGEAGLGRCEIFLHMVMAANALTSIVELIGGFRLLPYVFDGVVSNTDTRPAGLLGHPLYSAFVAGAYVSALLTGGGRLLPRSIRGPLIILQFVSLTCLAGRMALLGAVCVALVVVLRRLLTILAGGGMTRGGAAITPLALLALAFALIYLASHGFFDVLLGRLVDADSDAARVRMLSILSQVPLPQLFIGAEPDLMESLQFSNKLEVGIESPIIRLTLFDGAIFTAVLLAGLAVFLLLMVRRLRSNAILTFVYFAFVVNTFDSIGNKSLLLAQFTVVAMVMFRRPGRDGPGALPSLVSYARENYAPGMWRPRAATTLGSNARDVSSTTRPIEPK